MKKTVPIVVAAFVVVLSSPAWADETDPPASDVTISGGATLVSDYRFRGISQTDKNFAVQGTFTVSHSSGFYASVWGSSVSDYIASNSQEIDLVGGYKHSFGATTVDVGATYYYYPGSALPFSDFIEPYVAVSHTLGPVTGKVSLLYAPKQQALSVNGVTKDDNLYLAADLSAGIPDTPISLSAHVGHNFSPSYITFGNKYTDWSIGATYTWKNLSLGVSYVDTDKDMIVGTRNETKAGVVGTLGVAF
ncbi:TorF family putative porin [Sphingobium subterraneum]|uniref:Uncharacterized protein (TIGR02001 family) n=1 Tax=Sphingobium subterraneum TaxID=627688 RepID=A0A841J435_9SPHN|nr:TorF family putative porin [Sphingobium subterraneum]MBB6125470.1 uncharacterized protein (TIGR02001 family) [Sphingobium subterraneum]